MADRYTYEPLNVGDIVQAPPKRKSRDHLPAVLLFVTAFFAGFALGRITEHKVSYAEGRLSVLNQLPFDCVLKP